MAPRMISAVIGSSRRRRRAPGGLGRRVAGRLAIGVPIPRGAVVCARRGRGAVDRRRVGEPARAGGRGGGGQYLRPLRSADRKSTRLNSSHLGISYAVFCLKKKKEDEKQSDTTVDVRSKHLHDHRV